MFPWPITISTDLSPDQVCMKLARTVRASEADASLGTIRAMQNSPLLKTLGGQVDHGSHEFRLIPKPYIATYGTVYIGRVERGGGKSQISFWLRPSLTLLFADFMLSAATLGSLRFIFSFALNSTWFLLTTIIVVGWVIFVLDTAKEAKRAKELFEHSIHDAAQHIPDRFHPGEK